MKKPVLKYTLPDNASATDLDQLTDHNEAIRRPRMFELAIVRGVQAWDQYACCHKQRYESQICDDAIIGYAWLRWGISLRDLLNGESGRLNCGYMSTYINEMIKYHGGTEQDLEN